VAHALDLPQGRSASEGSPDSDSGTALGGQPRASSHPSADGGAPDDSSYASANNAIAEPAISRIG